MRVGDILQYAPSYAISECSDFFSASEYSPERYAGDNANFSARGILVHKELKRGYVGGDTKNDPPLPCVSFQALILCLTQDKDFALSPGDKCLIDCHRLRVECKVERLVCMIDKRNGRVLSASPPVLTVHQAGQNTHTHTHTHTHSVTHALSDSRTRHVLSHSLRAQKQAFV
jgi:elongation factor 1-alpha